MTGSRPIAVVIAAVATAAISAAVCVASVLVPAPAAALPLVVAVCIGAPMFSAWELPGALASLRAERAMRTGRSAMAKLRHSLAQLPETDHPLGL